MIDLDHLRANPEAYKDAALKKGIAFKVEEFLLIDKEYRTHKQELESLRAKQNAFNKELRTLKGQERDEQLVSMKQLATEVKGLEAGFSELEAKWNALQLKIPSIPSDDTPTGKDDTENVPIRTWGEIPSFDFNIKDHVQLNKDFRIFDIERGVKIAGSRNYFLVGDGARLQRAVLALAQDLLHKKGYTLMDPPHIVQYRAMMGTGYFPGGEEQAYNLDDRDEGFSLIGTSEVPVASYHCDEILDEAKLPIKLAGYSPCYRRESGTYGKDTHGLYRVHQFYKVEQVIICRNDVAESEKMHAELLGNAEELMQLLEIPYQVVQVCTGDLGQGQIRKNDIEAWMPSREKYAETHSCSTFYEFQARRLQIRYKNQSENKNYYCHTLNNTLVASPRILIPLLELNQAKDGSIKIPTALQPYMGGQTLLEKTQ